MQNGIDYICCQRQKQSLHQDHDCFGQSVTHSVTGGRRMQDADSDDEDILIVHDDDDELSTAEQSQPTVVRNDTQAFNVTAKSGLYVVNGTTVLAYTKSGATATEWADYNAKKRQYDLNFETNELRELIVKLHRCAYITSKFYENQWRIL